MPRRMKNIYKRKDGRWEARYIKEYDANGKARYSSVYARSYAEVRTKLLEAVAECDRKYVDDSEITVSEWFLQWMSDLRGNVKSSTYAVYERYYTNHINPFMGGIRMSRLNERIIQGFVNSLDALSPASIKNVFRFLKSGLSAAEENHLMQNVCDKIKLPKAIKREPVRVFSKKEQTELENAVSLSSNPNGIGIIICLYTGLRVGELCGLMWEDVNFKASTISVRRTVQRIRIPEDGKKTSVITMPPKSISSIRDIPIPKFLAEKLTEHKKLYGNASKYIINNEGKMTEPRYCQYHFAKILEKAKIKPAKFHTTRHTFATRALESGMDIKTLSEVLGHADATITMKRYAHSSDEQKRICIEKLADSVFNDCKYGQICG